MPFARNLYAVVSHAPQPPRTQKRNIVEIRQEKYAELHTKKAIDRADAVLDRLEQRTATYKSQIAELQKRLKVAQVRSERIEEEILQKMTEAHLDKVDGFHAEFQARPCPKSLVVDDESQIPLSYLRETLVSVPDKNAIKSALARGEEIGGVRLSQKIALVRK